MIKVTVSTITERGVLPQFFGKFQHQVLADEYASNYRKLAAQAGVMVRIDKEMVQC